MSSVQKPSDENPSVVRQHVWDTPEWDLPNRCHVWRCSCDEIIYQAFGEPAPDELISHPQSFGQMRGEPN